MADTPTNFGSILDMPADQIERPKPLPTGTYLWRVKGMPKLDKSTKKQTDFAEFTLVPMGAGEDVDKDALTECLGGENLAEKEMTVTFYLTKKAGYRLVEFLEALGIERTGKTPRQMIQEAPNTQVLGVITHSVSEDGTTVYANVNKFVPYSQS